ncbi:hypothetical protein TNCV_752661 [Trichonephila clavipes]|uniref:Uncharacterized protein n=1 Tax=Trichonephila clavipes TaxID=2585209 RepID=A0A8X7BHC2_TRICX|nr:hypothetical protein TNCV_752661 [Trichonephila clavipes]
MGLVYLDMLENFAVSQIPPGLLFQQDGTPPPYHVNVTVFCNRTFLGNWIGRGCSIAWPPRSLDLTLLKFFACGFTKSAVHNQSYNYGRERVEGTYHSSNSSNNS